MAAANPDRKRRYRNLDELVRAQPVPKQVSDEQIRQMLVQLLLDYPAEAGVRSLGLMRTKLDIMGMLHRMNHVKDKDDELSSILMEKLSNRKAEDR